MIEFLKTNWQTVLPIVISLISAAWAFFIWKRQKHIENKFTRSLAAYDIVLKKEFDFYEQTDSIYAQLIPGVQDIIDNIIGDSPDMTHRMNCAKENMLKFLENIPKLKDYTIQYDIYIPERIVKANSNAIQLMQSNMQFISDELEKLFNGQENEIDKSKCSEIKDSLLFNFATVRGFVKTRLHELTKI